MRHLVTLLAILCCPGPAFAAGWFADLEAGVRFPRPFDDGERKTGDQIRALINAKGNVIMPEEMRYTSGLYATTGVPYLLVWVRPEARPPTRAELEDQGFDVVRLEKIMNQPANAPGAGALKSRVLIKPLKDRTAFIGLFYELEADLPLFEQVRLGLEVEPKLSLDAGELAPGRPSIWLRVVVGLGAAGLAAAFAWMLQRRSSRR